MKNTALLLLLALASFSIGCNHFVASTITPLTPIPSSPANFTATVGDKQVTISWSPTSGATSYNIFYSTSPSITLTTGTLVRTSQTTYTFTGLTNGTTYYFLVSATNSSGESTVTGPISAKPVSPVQPPSGITLTPGDGQVTVSWTAFPGASTYNIYYSRTSPVSTTTGTKIGGIVGTSYSVTSLSNGTPYYFVVTTVMNSYGESVPSAEYTSTPTGGGTASLAPGTGGTIQFNFFHPIDLTFNFAPNSVGQPATVTIEPVLQSQFLAQIDTTRLRGRPTPLFTTGDTFLAAFSLSIDPVSITSFNVPVNVGGSVGTSITPGATLNLAILDGSNWVDVATFVIGANGKLNENLASFFLPGLLRPGTYLLYEPAKGSNTSVSNLGVVLLADDGARMADGHNGLQVIHIYNANGNPLATPSISYLDYSNAGDLDGQAMTPDGSHGIMVDGGNTVRFFSAVQTGVPLASTTTVDISSYGGDGDSVAILPNGDEAVVSGDGYGVLLLVSGIASGTPVATSTIAAPGYRDGLVISNDGTVMLARGGTGLTVYAVAPITPAAGSIGGTVSHSFTQVKDFTNLGVYNTEDGRDGMAISPVDSSRAVVVSPDSDSIYLVSGLTSQSPSATSAVQVPGVPYAVSITPDGKLAIVGTSSGLVMYKGVDTGTLVQVGATFQPDYSAYSTPSTLGTVYTLGITLDGKYVVAGDNSNNAIVVIPFDSNGFGTPVGALGNVAIPYNDQMLIH